MSPPSIPLDPEADYAREERVRGAAPDLLAAAKAMVSVLERCGPFVPMDQRATDEEWDAAEAQGRSAIAKAEGRS